MVIYEQPKVSGNVDAFCSKCEMDLAHTVVAMVEGKVVQARCNTCGAFHKYRRPKKATARAAAPARRATTTATKGRSATGAGGTRRATSWEATWNAQVEQAGERAIRPYRMADQFEKGDLVQHKSFGLGVVQQIAGPSKAEILFREGMRTLVMGRG